MISLELDDADAALFSRLANDPRVIVPTTDLGEGFEDRLASLEAAGLATAFEWDGGFAASLTPLGAAGAGLRAARSSRSLDDYRWEPIDEPEKPDRLSGRKGGPEFEAVDPESLVDRRLHSPIDTAAAVETVDRDIRRAYGRHVPTSARLLPPRVLLDGGCRPWFNPTHPRRKGKPCPVCERLPLDDRTYCLLCCRWGLDDVLDRFRAAEVRKAEAARRKVAKFRPHSRPKKTAV